MVPYEIRERQEGENSVLRGFVSSDLEQRLHYTCVYLSILIRNSFLQVKTDLREAQIRLLNICSCVPFLWMVCLKLSQVPCLGHESVFSKELEEKEMQRLGGGCLCDCRINPANLVSAKK